MNSYNFHRDLAMFKVLYTHEAFHDMRLAKDDIDWTEGYRSLSKDGTLHAFCEVRAPYDRDRS
jgi:hypothetical protein